jgi:hypothetical protein
MQKVFLTFVVGPTWELLKDIAPKSYACARGHLTKNLQLWTELAETGDPSAIIRDPRHPSELVYVSPIASPFHVADRISWYVA